MLNVAHLLRLLTDRIPPGPHRSHGLTLPQDNAPPGTALTLSVWWGSDLFVTSTLCLDDADMERTAEDVFADVLKALTEGGRL